MTEQINIIVTLCSKFFYNFDFIMTSVFERINFIVLKCVSSFTLMSENVWNMFQSEFVPSVFWWEIGLQARHKVM